MKNYLKWAISLGLLLAVIVTPFRGVADDNKEQKEKPIYQFQMDYEVERTSVKNQYRTGTCWCFATISFLESELLRSGKEGVDLSEMFVVRHTYAHKAVNYIRMHGRANFGQGGQSHDVIDQIKRYGIVPEDVYTGMHIDEKRHNHGEMATILRSMLDAVLKQRARRVTPKWLEAFEAVLDVYLGTPPETFSYKGKIYTPKSFAQEHLDLNLDSYIELTSFSHYPFYKKCRLDVPDNWTHNSNYFNVTIDDLELIVDHAIKNGYSVVWDGDVSERDFDTREKGYAVVPLKDWEDKSLQEREEEITEPVEEKVVTQEMRQKTFNNFTTTDDHLMHIVGIAHDQNGTKFYFTKNSQGTDREFGGYVYLSRSYFRLKTLAIMVHKDSLLRDLKTKLGIR